MNNNGSKTFGADVRNKNLTNTPLKSPRRPILFNPNQNNHAKTVIGGLDAQIQREKRKKASIVIPNDKGQYRSAKTARNSMTGASKNSLINSANSVKSHNIDDLEHRDTTNGKIIEELVPLIQGSYQFMEYDFIKVLAGHEFQPRPPSYNAKKKRETIETIESIVLDPVLRNALSLDIIQELVEFIKRHIFRKIPKFQEPNEFSEVSQNYIIQNWEHILQIHSIFQNLLTDIDFFGPLLNNDFTQKLVQQLDSPNEEESETIEKEIAFILMNYVGYRNNILHHLLSRVVLYLDGVKTYTLSMAPTLRLFLDYFRSLPLPLKQNNFLLFRTVFYPLFSTDLAYMFESSLHELSGFFQMLEPATALWCLNYLKSHWPCASTTKQILFFHQFMNLLPTQPATILEKVGPLVLKTIAPCITSQNYRVACLAISFASDPDFIAVYKPIPDAILEILMPAVKEAATNHWNEYTREIALRLLDQLSDFHFRSKPKNRALTATQRKTIQQPLGWASVIEAAVSNDQSIDSQQEQMKVQEMEMKCENIRVMTS